MPRPLAEKFAGMHQQALLVMILLLVVLPWISPSLNVVGALVFPPAEWLTGYYLDLAVAVARS